MKEATITYTKNIFRTKRHTLTFLNEQYTTNVRFSTKKQALAYADEIMQNQPQWNYKLIIE